MHQEAHINQQTGACGPLGWTRHTDLLSVTRPVMACHG